MKGFKLYLLIVASLTGLTTALSTHHANIKRQVSQLRDSYDFVIVGGGTSGLTVADRLSEAFPQKTVLVVEYGDVEYAPASFDPPLDWYGPNSFQSASLWVFRSLPNPEYNNLTALTFAGQVVGGSSAINGQFFDRPSRFDFDSWTQLGVSLDWNWRGMLPYFKRSTKFTAPSSQVAQQYNYTWDLSSYGGITPIHSSFPPFQWADNQVVLSGWKELGVRRRQDCAGGDKEGLCAVPTSGHPVTAKRSHAGLGHYADVVDSRSNFDLLVRHQVVRVVYPNGVNSGPPTLDVRSLTSNARFTITANAEVVLSAGALHTPTVLLRSGIGATNVLATAGIPQVLELPGVGANLQDHPGSTGVAWNYTKPGNWTPMPEQMSDLIFKADATTAFNEVPARGPYTMALGNQAIYISLPNTTPNYPAIIRKILRQTVDGSAASFLPPDYRDNAALVRGYKDQLLALSKLLLNPKVPSLETPWSTGYSTAAILLHPLSRGTVRLNLTDHLAQPLVDTRHGSNPVDFDMQLANVRWSRRLLDTPTMKRYGAVEISPGQDVQSDSKLLEFIKSAATLSYQHPCCTAALGPKNRGGVVDNKLRVHGVKGLRVVDISVLPLVISAHTSSTAYALGEKVGFFPPCRHEDGTANNALHRLRISSSRMLRMSEKFPHAGHSPNISSQSHLANTRTPLAQCEQYLALLSNHSGVQRFRQQYYIIWEAALAHATNQSCSMCQIITDAAQCWFTTGQLAGVQLKILLVREGGHEKDRFLIQFGPPARLTPWTEGQTINFFMDDPAAGPWNLMQIPISKESFSAEAKVKRMKEWLSHCQNYHSTCSSFGGVMLPENLTLLPSRVLDLFPKSGGICLYESRGQKGRYACLSHRWGHCQPLTTTRATIDSWKKAISWYKVPKLFQDAIDIARQLGIRYLWIDSLCIIQDDADDWYQESRKMCSIYQNSVVTIAGTAGFGCEDSLIPARSRTVIGNFKDNTPYRFEARLTDKHLSGSPSHIHFGKTLLGRGWVYQERLLSRRIIHCCSDELVWECMESMDCECPEGVPWMTTADKSRLDIKAIQNRLSREASLLERQRVWHDMVRAYTELDLTKLSDRPVAILGLAVEMQYSRNGLYAAGLWEDSLLSDLAWHTGTRTPRGKKPTGPRPSRDLTKAPTWSWLSVGTCCEYWSRSDLGAGTPSWEDSGTVVEKIELPLYHTLSTSREDVGLVQITPRMNVNEIYGKDTSKPAAHGCLTLRGRLLTGASSQSLYDNKLEWSDWLQSTFEIDLNVQDPRVRGLLDIRDTEYEPVIRQGGAVFALPLGTSIESEGLLDVVFRYQYLLLLVLVDADKKLYERVGLIELGHGDYEWTPPGWWDVPFEMGVMTTVKII
ncbi:putative GMC oxidoreductase [Triangularia setosa]|uniref:GMC oxidoreductase n=1 Tax=Triangularia setosa TaxID=2587417 RepID=A0AAN7A7G3_9PEZI|nr:putative GMC oxidoreductase [Podospora setosa]